MSPATEWGCKGHRGLTLPPIKRGKRKVSESLKVAPWGWRSEEMLLNVPCVPFEERPPLSRAKHRQPRDPPTPSPQSHLVAIKSAASLSGKVGKGVSDLVC